MKKLLIILSCVFFYSCNLPCSLAQMPPQFIYADQNCIGLLPDYRTKVTVTGGCTGFTLSQIPAPGSAINKTTSVTIRALGTNLKSSQITFPVTLVDTITPKITVPIASVDELLQKSRELYDAADKTVGHIDRVFSDKILVVVSWDSAGVRQRAVNYTDSFGINILKWRNLGN